MKVLCVAEKNSIAKGVSSILGGGSVRTRSSGYQYVKNYDFQFDGFPFTQYPCSVTMTSVAGHLKGIDFRGEQYKWGKGDIYPLFDAPLMDTMNNDQRHIASNIRREAQRADFLVIWTDCDREGEYIGWEIFQEANIGNEELTENQMYRAVFSHVERNHILHAARNTIRLDMKSVDAVSTRIELDLRTGVTFTRLLTNTLKRRVQNARIEPGQSALSYMNQEFNTRKESFVISYGPCQFPTLGFVVDRFERIRNFIPEEFWYIQVQISDGMCSTDEEDLIFSDRDEDEEIFKLSTMTTTFQWQRNHLFDRHSVLAIYEMCLERGGDQARVCDLKSKPATKYRPFPLTTVELQKNCARYLGINAKRSLASAERLYQKGFISYPRTETDTFPATMDLKDLIAKQTEADPNIGTRSDWAPYAANLLDESSPNKFTFPRSGRHDDKAHPPIHPIIRLEGSARVDMEDRRVYEYIVRHFLACCSQDARGQTTTLTLDWVGEKFTATGLVVLERNFLDVYPWAKWETTKQLPRLEIGEICELTKAEMGSGMTSPPKPMTESELIVLMDANGIGTDATIAEHIDKIQQREYVKGTKSGKETILNPTKLGITLVHAFERIGLEDSFSKPFQRREMEEDLKKICEGQLTGTEVRKDIIRKYKDYWMKTNQCKTVFLDTYNVVERTIF